MRLAINNLVKQASTVLSIVLLSTLPLLVSAQTATSAITLDPPTGLDLLAHTTDGNGNKLSEAPANFRRLGEARVGEVADLHTLTLRFSTATKLTKINPTKDFKVEQGGSCVEGNAYNAGSTCSLLVRFTPQGAGHRLGKLTISHTASATPMAIGLSGNGYAPVIDFIPAVITTVPGTYPASVGLLNGAHNLAIDGGDTLYAADTGNNVIRMLDSSGVWTNVSSSASAPWGVGADSFGEVWYSNPAANSIHEVYAYGVLDFQANGAGTDACAYPSTCTLNVEQVTKPGSITIDQYDNMYFAEGTRGAAWSAIHPEPTTLTRLADPFTYQTGNPGAFTVNNGILFSAWTSAGACQISTQPLYYAETGGPYYSKVAGGRICGFSGDGGLAKNAEISTSLGQFTFDLAGNLYFTDTGNQRVRKIDYTTGIIRTIAGYGLAGYTNDGRGAFGAYLANPTGVAVDSQGQVYIISGAAATGAAQVIRKTTTTGWVNIGTALKGTKSLPVTVLVSNNGNSPQTLVNTFFSGPNPAVFAVDPTTTTCLLTAGAVLNVGQTCRIGFAFSPTSGAAFSAYFNINDNSINGTESIYIIGQGTLPAATVAITSPTPGFTVKTGTPVTFSVTVTSASGPAPTGTVQFKVDGASYGAPVALASGAASTSVTGLTIATHTLSVVYNGDVNYAAGTTASVSTIVTAAIPVPKVALVTRTPAATTCTQPALAALVTAPDSILPTGTASLYKGSRLVETQPLVNGQAAFQYHHYGQGNPTFTASYSGDAHLMPAISPAMNAASTQSGSCQHSGSHDDAERNDH